jgi:predicted SprT family Zn-dependent metalloprotease
MKNLYKIFSLITIISIVLLVYVVYNDQTFKNSELSSKILIKLKQKEYDLRKLVIQKYNITVNIPVLISSKLQDNLFGIAAYNNGDIKIVLNKSRFQESENYMIDYVLPHEYAHALMFVFNDFPKQNGGHSKKWQNICISLDGKKCDRFVKNKDIVMDKLDFLY